MARKRRRGLGCLAIVLLLAAGVAAAIWVPGLFERHAYKLETQSCIATHGDLVDYKTAEQANNAAIIAAVGMSYGFDVQGVTVAIATAIQESDLRSLDYGDRDSLGLFQQRPSQGWGEPEQVIDPHYASSKFYQALERVEGWQDMPLTVAAQAVQRSGFPDAYAAHEQEALAWATALTGGDATVDCHNTDGLVSNAQAFAERLSEDYGAGRYAVDVLDVDGDRTTVGVTALDGLEASARSVREWAVATASATGAIESSGYGAVWINGEGRSTQDDSDAAIAPIQVVIATR
jgi:hypothetical protein